MRKFLFAQLSRTDLESFMKLDEHGIRREPWEALGQAEITQAEQQIIDRVTTGLGRVSPSLVNEATVWGRAIFPLLLLAESDDMVAQAEVPLSARFGDVELAGSADGAFGTPIAGELRSPFLIVVEAKRGIEGYSPVPQLYGEMLAAAALNAKETGRYKQRMYGCYTVADDWTFVCADIEGLDGNGLRMSVFSSPEIDEKMGAATIVRLLKSIVARHRQGATSSPLGIGSH